MSCSESVQELPKHERVSPVELLSHTTDDERKNYVNDGQHPKKGDQCTGKDRFTDKQCQRFYDIDGKGKWSFKKTENNALTETSSMKSPVEHSEGSFRCMLCKEDQGSEDSKRDHWKRVHPPRKHSCCPNPKTCLYKYWMKCRGTPEIEYYWPGQRKYNPIWTGDDTDQIGIFIRNLTVLGLNENLRTISVQFYLNIVWLDEGFCNWTREQNKLISEALGAKWYIQLRKEDYETRYKEYLNSKRKAGSTDWLEALKGSKQRQPEKQFNTLPNVVIWNANDDGYREIENLISLNKGHIGKNTVYWRRLIRATLNVNFHSRSFPFGYESFRMQIRLLSWTGQHFVLLRTKLWHNQHLEVLNGSSKYHKEKYENMDTKEYECKEQINELLANHSFSYIHPDNSRIPDWNVCSVHGLQDQWLSPFDNNDLEFRLPVRVTRGLDTQSSFEAMIVLKHLPKYVLWNSWFWFSLSTILALLTYQLHPDEWEGRLAIAVAVIFVQMNLRNHTCQYYPRVGRLTALDIHISACVFCVLLQAFFQCFFRYINGGNDTENDGNDTENDAETNSENLRQFDHWCGWVNLILVILMNITTFGLAICWQRCERLDVESNIKCYTGFNMEPLGECNKLNIEDTVKVKERERRVRLQVYGQILEDIKAGRSRTCSSIRSETNLLSRGRTWYRNIS